MDFPSGTVTFLFTDVEGSTDLWRDHPEAMKPALARHDELVRAAITGHRGHVVKTTGDGFHAVFADAHDAAGAAIAAQLALTSESWAIPASLPVRMGMHTGPAEQRDGDYYGTAVNKAARLMSAAHGEQVVVSLVTGELIRDSLPADVELTDLGEHAFRGIGRPERVFQLSHAELRREFPELASLEATLGNLPTPVTSFVGREEDLARVAALLDDTHLVTLIGVGGVGKTRLALQVASEVSDRFPDGAWFADLAAVPDDESVPLALGTALGMATSTGDVHADTVVQFIGGKSMLVVLDNCEHVIDAVGDLAEGVVRRCPDARLIATSREGLAVDGEHLWPVRPLGVPAERNEAVASAPVHLFLDRVRALRPDFALDAGATDAVIDICRRLDGLPLAIELAAARARSLAPRDIAERLDRRFSLLSGGKRRGVARHETLRAAVDWSYELLADEERTVLDRVAVFAGGFTLDAAEVVADEPGLDDPVVDTLDALVDKSLLAVDGGRETTRYRLLETIRQYALEKLEESGDTAGARNRHLAFLGSFAERAGTGLLGPDEAEWSWRTEDELDNLRAALAWAVERGDASAALRLATAFSGEGYFRYTWGLDALAGPAIALPGAAEQPEFPLALTMAARRRWNEGDIETATTLATDALTRALAQPDTPLTWEARARAELCLGNFILSGDGTGDAAEHFERAVHFAARSPVASTGIVARGLLSTALPNRGPDQLDAALVEAETCRRLALESRCDSLIASAAFSAGYLLFLRGDPAALEPLRQAAASATGSNQPGALGLIALHEMRHGTPTSALDAIAEAVMKARDSGDRNTTANSLDLAWPLLIRYGDPEAAAVMVGSLEKGAVLRLRRSGVAQDGRERAVASLSKRLSAADEERWRGIGAAMGYDEVIAYALEHVDAARTRMAETAATGPESPEHR